MRAILIPGFVAALLSLCLTPVQAQRPWSLGLGGGVSFPMGDFADAADMGWNALAVIERASPMQPASLRLDVAYNQFSFSDASVEDESQNTISGTLNVTYRMPSAGWAIGPYVIAGLGAYRSDCSVDNCESVTRFGWNAGLGIRMNLLGFRNFLEARYHRTRVVGASLSYVPVTFAITF